MIDLDQPLDDYRANQLRNQVAGIKNLMNQMDDTNQDDIGFLCVLRIEFMRRGGELTQRVALG